MAKTHVTGLVEATKGVTEYSNRLERVALLAARDVARIIEGWEKSHHIWQNRTFDAEKRLKCAVFRQGMLIILENSHGVYYGLYLELHHERKFAILEQALRRHWFLFMQTIQTKMSTKHG
jgi:hypothetical protein